LSISHLKISHLQRSARNGATPVALPLRVVLLVLSLLDRRHMWCCNSSRMRVVLLLFLLRAWCCSSWKCGAAAPPSPGCVWCCSSSSRMRVVLLLLLFRVWLLFLLSVWCFSSRCTTDEQRERGQCPKSHVSSPFLDHGEAMEQNRGGIWSSHWRSFLDEQWFLLTHFED
jgi:hypothetical protein